jgi:thioredoxin reductase
METGRLDVVVVGGGPAGLSAALVLARARRSVALIDEGKPRNAPSRAVHNFLSRDGIAPSELLQISRAQLAAYPTVRFLRSRAVDAQRLRHGFEVVTAEGERVLGRKLILATGLTDQLPAVPGMMELYGRGVFSCPYCDGWELRDRPLVVYGRDDERGGQFALELTGWSRDIVLCTDGPSELTDECRARLERNGIAVRPDRVVRLEPVDARSCRVVFERGEALARHALFVFGNYRQASDLAGRLGSPGFSPTDVKVQRHGRAGVDGLFVIGDASRDVLQVAVAAGEGCEAAITVNCELLREDLR